MMLYYGINVAKLAELPNDVITNAYKILKDLESDTPKSNVEQLSMNFDEPKKDELREYIKTLNPLEMTPLEALNIIYEITKKAKEN